MTVEHQQYWTKFQKFCEEKKAPLTLHSPSGWNNIGANLGPNLGLGFRVDVVRNAGRVGVDQDNIAIRISVPKSRWKYLKDREEWRDIADEFDSSLQINPVKEGKYKEGQQIILYKDNVCPGDGSDWENQFEWFVENLSRFAELFRSCFHPRLPQFHIPEVKKGSIEKDEKQQKMDLGEAKETRLSSEDLLTLRNISQDLQTLLAKYNG